MMRLVTTPEAPRPAGHYSQAVVHGGLVYVAGQLAIDPVTNQPVHGTLAEQVRLTIRNIEAILRASGSRLDLVVQSRVYIPDVSLWPAMNAEYAACFGGHRPARMAAPSGPLHHGLLFEMEVVAAVAEGS